MFNSAISILENYLHNVTPYNFQSIEMERGQNPEDLYYLCNISDNFYVVFQTDYIGPTPYQAKEIAEIFGVEPAGWLVKKDQEDTGIASLQPAHTSLQANFDSLVSMAENSYFKHAVLVIKDKTSKAKRFNPNTYGYTESA